MFSSFSLVLSSVEDQNYIKELYVEYHRLMYSIAGKYFTSIDDCQDLVQSCFVRLIDHVDTLRTLDQRALISYIATTVNNAAYTYFRKDRSASLTSIDALNDTQDLCTEDFVVQLLSQLDRKALITKVWPKLSHEDRALLEGKYILNYNNNDLAKYFDCKPDSIRMKLCRARRNALKLLEEENQSV